ncbi:hypothetical protein CRG98_019429 [Punica granatum]|uniref:Beta-glucosidase 12-like n=1 Tax=Punica granatum TaxID=22663 RepID=A0A2I0JVD0_PUNGR|nr:hypothetical protein CRG98_019429 [Punica granatum]
MNNYRVVLLLPFVLGLHITNVIGYDHQSFPKSYATSTLNRSSFPAGFVFGAASSSYQYEGVANEDGRGPSIWDNFTHTYPGAFFSFKKIADGSNGDVAVDQYHKYKEDVGIMKEMGLDAYRFSISWSRILPSVNPKGIQYYNNLINELLAHGIQPYVTLFHWDLPQTLDDEYGGFLSPRIVDDYRDFADFCFKEFGDRVKYWITFNKPWTYCNFGYATGSLAPGRCSAWQNLNCTGGDSGTEPYLVAHHLLLAHASAVKLYKEKYETSQKGVIGITLVSHWFEPYSNSGKDRNAALRALDFMLGWALDPLIYGDYPYSMRSLAGSRLPKFSHEQSAIVKGSFDFNRMNYYTANYAKDAPQLGNTNPSYTTDSGANLSRVDEFNNSTLPLKQQLYDPMRIDYYYKHLSYLLRAIKEGANVKGYFAWSLLDNFEWGSGYTVRFGINYVDYQNRLKRYPKYSAFWFKSFLKKY